MTEKKENRGGAGRGQGRKATGIKRKQLVISVQAEESEMVKKKAKQAKKTVSKYIIGLVTNDPVSQS